MAEIDKLSEEQIFDCLRSLNVPVRKNDIKVPTCEFMVRVFECFLKDLQIDVTSPELRTWEATKHIEDGDIYDDAQSLILLVMHVKHITDPLGLNITVKDIFEPKPKRTKKILNYLIVFWSYYVQKYAQFQSVEKSLEGEKKKYESLILENESLDEKYNDMLKILSEMTPKEELLAIAKVKDKKMEELTAEGDAITSTYQNLKTNEVNVKSQIGAIDVKIITAKEKLEELSELILSSPDRINKEIKAIQDRIKFEEMKIKEWENRTKDTFKSLELKKEDLREREQILKSLKEADESIKNLKDTVRSVVEIHQKISEKEEEMKRLEMELERKERENLHLKQRSAKFVLNTKKQEEALKNVLEAYQSDEAKLKKEVEFLKAKISNLQEELDSTSDRILDVIEKSKEAQARTKEREARFKARLTEIDDQFKSDCKEVLEAMQMPSSDMP